MRSSSDARSHILGKLRQAVPSKQSEESRKQRVANHLVTHAPNLIPDRARQPFQGLLNRFQTMLQDQGATVIQVDKKDAIPETIKTYLQQNGIPLELRHGQNAEIANLTWSKTPDLRLQTGPAKAEDLTSLSTAPVAAAETGTLFLLSGPDNPTSLNFLPENHIILIEKTKILGSYEECWTSIRDSHGEITMPRALNWISGPSRTADIEQTLIRGAHGPKRLFVIIWG